MTPHEQALRARLERVLQTSKVANSVSSPRRDIFYAELDHNSPSSSPNSPIDPSSSFSPSPPSLSPSSRSDSASASSDSDENAVRDENGVCRAWRGRQGAPRGVSGFGSPPSSSGRSESRDEGRRLQERSRTEPVLPAVFQQLPSSPYHPHPTPKRSTTAPNPSALKGQVPSSRYPQHPSHHGGRHQASGRHQRSGTTPPLVSDGSPTPPEDEDDLSDEIEDMRLLTPPTSPYHHPSHPSYPHHHHPSHPAHHYQQQHGYGSGYMPSPYMQKYPQRPLAPMSPHHYGQQQVFEDDEDDEFSNPESEYDQDDDEEDVWPWGTLGVL
ncbi:hypothetical protein NMY22_g18610 [Coprinellus aureogranulatus]|nr:hypothetical protein NMY22_g18610 [Coprinellus aureogranulatus]